MTAQDYVQMHSKTHPELQDFLSFDEANEDVDMEAETSEPRIFEDHKEYSDLLKGIQEGKLF
jgi:hypothetical protein